jgi:hypothetical protein
MKIIFRLTVVLMMIGVTIGAALESKLVSSISLVFMALTLFVGGASAILRPKNFDWITPSWVDQSERPIVLNIIAGIALITFSLFEAYIAFEYFTLQK